MNGIGWFSGGVTSAVAIKKALELGHSLQIYYFETGQHHRDHERFIKDCEKWYGQKIHIWNNKKWGNLKKVLEHGYINSPYGAYCTKVLKKDLRIVIEKYVDYDFQIFGFEYDKKQIKRAERFTEQYPNSKAIYPLIDHKMTKADCFKELELASIEKPMMYKLGYPNSNCIGCVKGGKKYWIKIKHDFPEIFKQTAELERKAGHSCINGTFLDELAEKDIDKNEQLSLPECGVTCEVEMMGIE